MSVCLSQITLSCIKSQLTFCIDILGSGIIHMKVYIFFSAVKCLKTFYWLEYTFIKLKFFSTENVSRPAVVLQRLALLQTFLNSQFEEMFKYTCNNNICVSCLILKLYLVDQVFQAGQRHRCGIFGFVPLKPCDIP